MQDQLKRILPPQMHRGEVLRSAEAGHVPLHFLRDRRIGSQQELPERDDRILVRMIQRGNEGVHSSDRLATLVSHHALSRCRYEFILRLLRQTITRKNDARLKLHRDGPAVGRKKGKRAIVLHMLQPQTRPCSTRAHRGVELAASDTNRRLAGRKLIPQPILDARMDDFPIRKRFDIPAAKRLNGAGIRGTEKAREQAAESESIPGTRHGFS